MTTGIGTGAVHFRMINCDHWNPCSAVVAGLTNIRRINVTNTFASGRCTIVTREASTIDLCMINRKWWNPAGTYMASFANVRRINVAGG